MTDALGRLTEPEQFEEIVIKSETNGQITRLKDVARGGARGQEHEHELPGRRPAGGEPRGLAGSPGATPSTPPTRVKTSHAGAGRAASRQDCSSDRLRHDPFIRESVAEVFKTLPGRRDPGGDRRPPVPAGLEGDDPADDRRRGLARRDACRHVADGLSLNNLTLFGLVLAIGIVVDDAIVVLENIERWIGTWATKSRDATINAMDEITGPIIAITLDPAARCSCRARLPWRDHRPVLPAVRARRSRPRW